MKSVLISIQPYWVFLIIAKIMGWNIQQGKTVEVRKSYPKAENWNKVVKIYCSKNMRSFAKIPKEYQPLMERFLGKVIGEFVCIRVYQYASDLFRYAPVDGVDISTEEMVKLSCLTAIELYQYEHSAEPKENRIYLVGIYGWQISQLKIYNEPKELGAYGAKGKCNLSRKCTEQGFLCAGYCKLTRPPQSWCYVEEL